MPSAHQKSLAEDLANHWQVSVSVGTCQFKLGWVLRNIRFKSLFPVNGYRPSFIMYVVHDGEWIVSCSQLAPQRKKAIQTRKFHSHQNHSRMWCRNVCLKSSLCPPSCRSPLSVPSPPHYTFSCATFGKKKSEDAPVCDSVN